MEIGYTFCWGGGGGSSLVCFVEGLDHIGELEKGFPWGRLNESCDGDAEKKEQ